ncbi:FkbM family methyltransferase [Aliarcobacter skirrowii]|uniref:FkbM family methyltransferase n=1 Tax=Aliarcobacter skirrowii TaxID=28200 RepID=UPI0029A82303|nr:FkbM family methyltransferase [Aliarcobacter skirrowii]MDX4038444.1 FkbM family methyltransferase [Aliarcobacter skirrowii]
MTEKIINIKDIKLIVNNNDISAEAYSSKGSYEEINSNLYQELEMNIKPEIFIDVGANYGFISILFGKIFRKSKIISIEASPILCTFIEKNFQLNHIKNYEIIQAICGTSDNEVLNFSLHPTGSQDNRVIPLNDNWVQVKSVTISLNSLLYKHKNNLKFIKIDVQGYEAQVIDGAKQYLENFNDWIIKMEFDPFRLKSQGSNPLNLLQYLVQKFNVYELPLRTKFKEKIFNQNKNNILKFTECERFIQYIQNNNFENRGWCDLLIKPKE